MAGAWGWESRAWTVVLDGNLAFKTRLQRQSLRPKQEKEMANVDALRAEGPNCLIISAVLGSYVLLQGYFQRHGSQWTHFLFLIEVLWKRVFPGTDDLMGPWPHQCPQEGKLCQQREPQPWLITQATLEWDLKTPTACPKALKSERPSRFQSWFC